MTPIDMVLHCPACGLQHVDKPGTKWANPPHRSHLCYSCGHTWRPADVPTFGVEAVKTKGGNDSPIVPTIDLQRLSFAELYKAVEESNWIPHDHYFMDDWVRDAAHFLRTGNGLERLGD